MLFSTYFLWCSSSSYTHMRFSPEAVSHSRFYSHVAMFRSELYPHFDTECLLTLLSVFRLEGGCFTTWGKKEIILKLSFNSLSYLCSIRNYKWTIHFGNLRKYGFTGRPTSQKMLFLTLWEVETNWGFSHVKSFSGNAVPFLCSTTSSISSKGTSGTDITCTLTAGSEFIKRSADWMFVLSQNVHRLHTFSSQQVFVLTDKDRVSLSCCIFICSAQEQPSRWLQCRVAKK